jgi:hypothetical protein
MSENEEDWEHEYPEGSLGWKINRKIDAIEEHALKSGTILLVLFAVLFVPAIVEIVLYPRGPFFVWQLGFGGVESAKANLVCYVVGLLLFVVPFFYYGSRLIWRGWRQRRR